MWLLLLFTAGCLTLFVVLYFGLFVVNGAGGFPVWVCYLTVICLFDVSWLLVGYFWYCLACCGLCLSLVVCGFVLW